MRAVSPEPLRIEPAGERPAAAPPSSRGDGEGEGRLPGPAAGKPPRPRLDTRRRLFLAFFAVLTAFVGAFAVPVVELARMGHEFAELRDHEHQLHLALDLEGAIRSQFAHQAHFLVGEDAHLAGYRDARARAVGVVHELAASVDEPEAVGWLRAIEADTAQLDRIFQEEIAPAVLGRAPGASAGAMLTHDRTYRLVFRVEENASHLYAFLRERAEDHADAVEHARYLTVRLAIGFAAGAGLFAIGIAVLLARSVAAPLAVIGAGAARIAKGDLSTRIEVGGAGEFGVLAAELNEMAAALRRHQEQLVRSEKLAGLGRLAAGIAHELNNPLQVILGYLALHRGRVGGELGTHLSRIEREATRCKEIVDSLLQLARPAASFVPVPVDLREVCEEVADALRMADGGKGPTVVVEGAGTALGTHWRFRQIVFNLARNAADAAGPAGTVWIRIGSAGADVEVAVSDSGPGVPSELRDRIFEPFFTTKGSGVGLGLAIARSFAHTLGGDVELAGSGPGGACFSLRVPAARGGQSR